MANGRTLLSRAIVASVAVAGVYNFRQSTTFLPPAGRVHQQPAVLPSAITAGGIAALFGAAPSAQADVNEAAGNFADKVYPIVEKIDWQRAPKVTAWLGTAAEKWDGRKLANAMEKLLDAGMSMDQSMVAQAVLAHKNALVNSRDSTNTVLIAPQGDVKEIVTSIANILTSAGAKKTYDVWEAFTKVGLNDLNKVMYADLGKGNTEVTEAYKAFLTLGEEVKRANPGV